MFIHAGLTKQELPFNSKICISQTELLKHFESVSVALTSSVGHLQNIIS